MQTLGLFTKHDDNTTTAQWWDIPESIATTIRDALGEPSTSMLIPDTEAATGVAVEAISPHVIAAER